MAETLRESETKVKKKSSFKIFLLFFLIILIIAAFMGKYYFDLSLEPIANQDNIEEINKVIEIPKGSTTKGIARILKDNNLIRNEYIFRIIAKMEEKDGLLKAGKHELYNTMSVKEILQALELGGYKKETITFTIPEGFELRQIADKLSEKGIINKEVFLELTSDITRFSSDYEFLSELPKDFTLEGYLFPETYEVYKDATDEDIIRKMLDQFDKVYKEYIKDKSIKSDLNLNQLITLASIVEREGKVDEERPIIAGVFFNRIDKGMLLESCATVQFALGERKATLSIKDTEIDSIYNTYLHAGLPPGPIASPGLRSIQAVIDPVENDYLFFVLKKDGSGTHIFTTNYQDHLRAKNNN